MSKREEIFARMAAVPPLPAASTEVIRLVQTPDIPRREIARAIEYDPSLTANLLRLANSAFFGFPQSVSSVKDALFRLGTNKVFQMVLATTIAKMAQSSARGYDVSSTDLWDHCIGTAIAATKIPQVSGIKAPDYIFTAALMHDIGKVVLGMFLDIDIANIVTIANKEKIALHEAERLILGIDHAEVGAYILRLWNLPSDFVDVARWHHEPDGSAETDMAVKIVHVADVTCLIAGVGTSIDALLYRPSNKVMSELLSFLFILCQCQSLFVQSAASAHIGRRSDSTRLYSGTQEKAAGRPFNDGAELLLFCPADAPSGLCDVQ